MNFDKNPMGDVSDGSDYGILKEDHDNLPFEHYAGLGYATHRYADFIPVADDKDQQALRASIGQIGLLDPIMLYQGAILDGRHRYKACVVLGVEPTFREFEGDDEAALQFVLAKNIARRQLTTGQKLSLLEKLRPELGRLRAEAAQRNRWTDQATTGCSEKGSGYVANQEADLVDLSRETVRQYKKISDYASKDEAMAEVLDQIKSGEVSVGKAYRNASAALDREANASRPNPMRQRAALASAIGKAKESLVNWDYSVLNEDYEVRADLEELLDWIGGALEHA